LLAIAEK